MGSARTCYVLLSTIPTPLDCTQTYYFDLQKPPANLPNTDNLPQSKHKLSSILGPMIPLRHNSDFPPGASTSFLSDSWPHSTIQAGQFYGRGHLLTQFKLATRMTNHTFPFWTYMQIRNFLEKPNPRPDWSRQTSPFESLCLKTEPQSHLISALLFEEHGSNLTWPAANGNKNSTLIYRIKSGRIFIHVSTRDL